jgi:fluoroacetyl-CoA thioesterase
MNEIVIGLCGTAILRVSLANTAAALGSGDVPVFGTPALVALAEQAAVRALAGRLKEGETTVGTWIEVSHLAATPVGIEVRAEAELTAIEGRQLTFAVRAYDSHERIGEGKHHRIIVRRERFLLKIGEKSGT